MPPATDQTTILFTWLVSANGKLVKQLANGHHAEGSYKYPVEVSPFPAGVYLCNLTVNDLYLTKKMIKEAK